MGPSQPDIGMDSGLFGEISIELKLQHTQAFRWRSWISQLGEGHESKEWVEQTWIDGRGDTDPSELNELRIRFPNAPEKDSPICYVKSCMSIRNMDLMQLFRTASLKDSQISAKCCYESAASVTCINIFSGLRYKMKNESFVRAEHYRVTKGGMLIDFSFERHFRDAHLLLEWYPKTILLKISVRSSVSSLKAACDIIRDYATEFPE